MGGFSLTFDLRPPHSRSGQRLKHRGGQGASTRMDGRRGFHSCSAFQHGSCGTDPRSVVVSAQSESPLSPPVANPWVSGRFDCSEILCWPAAPHRPLQNGADSLQCHRTVSVAHFPLRWVRWDWRAAAGEVGGWSWRSECPCHTAPPGCTLVRRGVIGGRGVAGQRSRWADSSR